MSKILRRLVLGLGIAVTPLTMIGCAEEKPAEAPKPAETPATPTPPPGGEAAKPAEGGATTTPPPAPPEAPK
jgi:hypothetical protein